MFDAVPPKDERCRVLHLSPLKTLAVDMKKNPRGLCAASRTLRIAWGYPSTGEIHTRVGTKRGARLALSLERFAEIVEAP